MWATWCSSVARVSRASARGQCECPSSDHLKNFNDKKRGVDSGQGKAVSRPQGCHGGWSDSGIEAVSGRRVLCSEGIGKAAMDWKRRGGAGQAVVAVRGANREGGVATAAAPRRGQCLASSSTLRRPSILHLMPEVLSAYMWLSPVFARVREYIRE